MITIDIIPASDYYAREYGITYESATRHNVTGRGVHNPSFPHRIKVWDNTRRENTDPTKRYDGGRPVGAGAYIDPNGRGTDAVRSFLVSSESIVISATPIERPPYGETLTIGDTIRLRFPDGTLSAPMTVTARPLENPVLLPAD